MVPKSFWPPRSGRRIGNSRCESSGGRKRYLQACSTPLRVGFLGPCLLLLGLSECTNPGEPDHSIDRWNSLPFVDCQGNTIYAIHIDGRSGSPSMLAWAGFVKNGVVVAHSAGVAVGSGSFSDVVVTLTIPPGMVAPDTYDLLVNLTTDPSKVGNLQGTLAMANPERINLSIPAVGRKTALGCFTGTPPSCLLFEMGLGKTW